MRWYLLYGKYIYTVGILSTYPILIQNNKYQSKKINAIPMAFIWPIYWLSDI